MNLSSFSITSQQWTTCLEKNRKMIPVLAVKEVHSNRKPVSNSLMLYSVLLGAFSRKFTLCASFIFSFSMFHVLYQMCFLTTNLPKSSNKWNNALRTKKESLILARKYSRNTTMKSKTTRENHWEPSLFPLTKLEPNKSKITTLSFLKFARDHHWDTWNVKPDSGKESA